MDWVPYCGAAPLPVELAGRWNLDPVLLLALAIGLIGVLRIGDGRRRIAGFGSVMLAVILFVSPLCALTSALFAARSVHHLVLTTAVAGLLVLALPRGTTARLSGGLLLWTPLTAITFWLWHLPELYEASYASHAVYWLMQASLLVTAAGFWAVIRHASPAAAIPALLANMVQMGLLGALLTFTRSALYAPHWLTTSAWGLTPLEDVQLGGLIMWVVGTALYLTAALAAMRHLLADEPAARSA